MQTLYTIATLENGAQGNKAIAERILHDKLDHVLDIFTVSILYLIRVSAYAETEAARKASKYLQTDEDKHANIKIAANIIVAKLVANASFAEKVKNSKLERFIDTEWLKKIFRKLEESAAYAKYTESPGHTEAADRAILQYIWEKEMLENEGLVSHFMDELPGWEDDGELIAMLMQNFFKGNGKINFLHLLSGEKKEYAHELLQTVIDKESYCMSLVEPKLKNWDKDRVALVDLLLLRMGICELLYFPTIPTKVTINEYIDIAKQYSTPQSGQFVNGILDNIRKDLLSENKITKQERENK